jgi:hypothetical protein
MTRNPLLDRRWLMPLVPAGLGAVILAAEIANGDLAEGLVWFVLLAGVGVLLAFGGRWRTVRDARGEPEDERDEMITVRALATSGQAMILILTGAVVFELARGENVAPYTWVLAVGGAVFGITLLAMRRYS